MNEISCKKFTIYLDYREQLHLNSLLSLKIWSDRFCVLAQYLKFQFMQFWKFSHVVQIVVCNMLCFHCFTFLPFEYKVLLEACTFSRSPCWYDFGWWNHSLLHWPSGRFGSIHLCIHDTTVIHVWSFQQVLKLILHPSCHFFMCSAKCHCSNNTDILFPLFWIGRSSRYCYGKFIWGLRT